MSKRVNIGNLLSSISIDCVVFGFKEGRLHVLLLKWKGIDKWALPSGFIQKEENLNNAAVRILQTRTGVSLPFLDQLYTFGDNDRKHSKEIIDSFSNEVLSEDLKDWIMQRFISTAYISLVKIDECNIAPDHLSDACKWIAIDEVPDLILDHNLMIEKGIEKLRHELNYLPIGLNILDQKFTMKDLQQLYESILARPLDRGNFQKKMLKLGFLDRHEKKLNCGAHKAPYLYSINTVKYNQILSQGIGFIN
ncbi:NUDIX domain-containing protein [Urechidicola sp. KH5]